MKKLFIILKMLFLNGALSTLCSQIIIDNELNIDNEVLVWNGEVRIQENVNVLASGKLVIEAGSQIFFENHRKFIIQGELDVRGELGNPVTFSSLDTIGFYDNTLVSGGWGGFIFEKNNQNIENISQIKNAVIENVKGITDVAQSHAIFVDEYYKLIIEGVTF